MEKICVAVRVRPASTQQETSNTKGTQWRVEDNRIYLHRDQETPVHGGLSYTFDHVFDETCTNSKVYELLTKDIIEAVVQGFNGTAFAYGQTSSGKTFTMKGSPTNPGIIHRAVEDVFKRIEMMANREFLIRVSYMEIYNEEINDLLSIENRKLKINESLERGIFVAGLKEEIVSSSEQVLRLLESGEVNRHFGETNMNARSSRSHTIFRMVIESKGKEKNSSVEDAIRVSVLNLVDLAGSERIAKTGAGGVRLKEGKHINTSLMILGKVINKLSEDEKKRGHIPFRDSKLTRILQPALGGNSKTSIICTVAPEEDHVEESKGTLQFASRAKRITNCVQVNEILTDAALLKRQKLEIEELRCKLQGSRSEVLEQEILKLRNEMLKYELDREKLEMQLEEERRMQRIMAQQIKIDQLNNSVTVSDYGGNTSEGKISRRLSLGEECTGSISFSKGGDAFKTPCLKATSNAFVATRSNHPSSSDFSPLPDSFSIVADEDMWMKMNKGCITDLDSLLMTPSVKAQSFPLSESPVCLNVNQKEEVAFLKNQLELLIKEKNDLEIKHNEQMLLNDRLMGEISELKQDALVVQEIPQRLCESVTSCKDAYLDILSGKDLVSDGRGSTAKLVSSTSDIVMKLLSTLEMHFASVVDNCRPFSPNDSLFREQREVLHQTLKSTITPLLSEALCTKNDEVEHPPCSCSNKEMTLENETFCLKEKLDAELVFIKANYDELEKELDLNNQLMEVFKEKYSSLENEYHLLKEERNTLIEERDSISKKLDTELKRRKNLEEDIKLAFASRQKSFASFHSDFKARLEKVRAAK